MERVLLQLVPSVQKRKLDHERHSDDLPAELADQPQGCPHRTTGGEEIVDGQHALAGFDRILVDRERVASVLELVFDLDGLARELAELAHGNETGVELMRESPTENEATRLDSDDDVDALFPVPLHEGVDDVTERRAVLQERGDVLEENAFGREVLDVADLPLELAGVHRGPSYIDAAVRKPPMCPKPWHPDTVCRLNVRALTAASNRSERLKTPVFQPGSRSGSLWHPPCSPSRQGRSEEEHRCCFPNKCSAWSNWPWRSSRRSGRSRAYVPS